MLSHFALNGAVCPNRAYLDIICGPDSLTYIYQITRICPTHNTEEDIPVGVLSTYMTISSWNSLWRVCSTLSVYVGGYRANH